MDHFDTPKEVSVPSGRPVLACADINLKFPGRLILVNVQGLTGSKIDYLSIPYSKVTKFSVETAGTFDLDAELKIWVGSDPVPVSKKFNKKVNIYDLQQVLAMHVLG